MAEKFNVEFVADVKKAMGEIAEMKETLEAIKRQQEEINKGFGAKLKNALKGFGKSLTSIKTIAKGAFGFGIVLELLGKLKEAFMQNQTTADAFAKVGVVLQGVFNALITITEPLIEALVGVFTKPQETIAEFKNKLEQARDWISDQFLDRMKDQFAEWGNNLGIVFQKIKGSILGVFSDDAKAEADARIEELKKENDEIDQKQMERNKRLKEDYEAVKTSVKETVAQVVEQVKATAENSTLLAEAEDRLAKMQIAQQGIMESKDREAEIQRQIRDNEALSLDERMKANEELGRILEEQADAEKAVLQEQINILEMQQKYLGFNKERENEILTLKNEMVAVDAKITGLQSEQKVNVFAINKEYEEMNFIRQEGELEIQRIEADGLEAREQNELAKLNMTLNRLDSEKEAELKALRDKRAAYAENSVTYAEMTKQMEIVEANSAQQRATIEKQVQQQKVALIQESLAGLKSAFGENSKAGKAIAIADAIINTYKAANVALGAPAPFNFIQMAGVLASGFANVRAIRQTEAGGTESTSTPPTPSTFSMGANVSIAGGNMNASDQLLGAINKQMNKPARSYVVGTDVTSQQSLDRKIIQNATFG